MPFLSTAKLLDLSDEVLANKKIKPAYKYHEFRKLAWERQAADEELHQAWRGGVPKGYTYFLPKPILLYADQWSCGTGDEARQLFWHVLRYQGCTEARLKVVFFQIWYYTPPESRLPFELDGQYIGLDKRREIYRAV